VPLRFPEVIVRQPHFYFGRRWVAASKRVGFQKLEPFLSIMPSSALPFRRGKDVTH
jgi:hypothetical protein